MSDDSEVPRLSVADALTNNVGLSRDHVQYKTLVARTQRKMADMVTKLEDMKRSSTPCFVTIALLPDEMRTLREVFPDFRMVDLGRMRVCHPLWSQLRRCATLWCLNQAKKLTDSVAVYSPCLLDVNEMGFEKARVLVDANSAVAVHERHNAAMDAFNVYRDFVRIGKGSSVVLKKTNFDDFCHGRGGLKVASYSKDSSFQYEKVDSLVVDGVLNDFSPLEVASMMRLHGASVAYGYIPYHPEMLMNLDGEIPGTGVHYTRTDAMLYLKYPEGTAGLVEYPMYSWSAWLTGHTFALGSSTAKSELRYQLELMNVRGGLLFYRIVHTPDVPLDMEIFHALDLPMTVPSYVVTSWRMRNLGLDPNKRDNWDQRKYLVSKRLVDRVYQFAMQLPREQFTRFAIRKQIRVANDRVTVEGTSVKVNSPVGNEIVDALVVDIFSRAFVDRYESGELTEFAKEYVNKLTSFSSSSTSQKLWMLCTISAVHVWEVTLEPVSKSIAALADAARAFFKADRGLTAANFEIAPTYVRLGGYADGLRRNGSADLARELSRQAGFYSRGPASVAVRAICQRTTKHVEPSFQFKAVAYPLFTTAAAVTQIVDEVVGYMKKLNPVDEPPSDRRAIEVIQAARQVSDEREVDFEPVADPVYVFNEMYSAVLPGVSAQNNEYDIASISFDPQDRQLVAPWLRIPLYMGDAPKAKIYYHSKIRALNVPKRQQTLQELLSAVASRQLVAPILHLPDDMASKAKVVWEFFLDKACVPDARQKLATYQLDQVALEEEAFREWASQSTPDKIRAVREELTTMHQSLAEMPVQDYIIMLKSDVKPTLSQKPIESRTEAQVIVYHAKALSAFYSCVFRVLVRRFLSIIRPNIHVNLLKDMVDIGDFVRGVHPFDKTGLRYLENDFSKYDKSQGLLAWELEKVAFSALGMNSQLLSAWLGGHVECNLRSLSLGLSLHVMFQRKSGDATTAFGNVLLNIVSVTYAYAGANVIWALFMGDDSLLCVDKCDDGDRAVRILAEDFNLSAKTYLSDSPYFASNFLLIDDFNHLVHFVPDPIKRIERWSMMINAEDPQWDERYTSARDSMRAYLNKSKTVLLPKLMAERYNAPPSVFNGIADAMATAVADKSKFRAMWKTHSEVSNY